jgi:hypothetical protein
MMAAARALIPTRDCAAQNQAPPQPARTPPPMTEIYYSEEFRRRYRELPLPIQKKAERREELFRGDPFHPSLKTEKLQPLEKEQRSQKATVSATCGPSLQPDTPCRAGASPGRDRHGQDARATQGRSRACGIGPTARQIFAAKEENWVQCHGR